MGISIAICELEAKNALCKDYKTNIIKALVDDVTGLEDIVEVDEYVTLENAKKLFPDWESFIKRRSCPIPRRTWVSTSSTMWHITSPRRNATISTAIRQMYWSTERAPRGHSAQEDPRSR